MTDAKKDDMMHQILSTPGGMRLSPTRQGFAQDRNFDGIPDILQYRDDNRDGMLDVYQTRGDRGGYTNPYQGKGDRNRAGHPSHQRSGSRPHDVGPDPYEFQLADRSRDGLLDRLMYADGDRNRDGIPDAFQDHYALAGYRGGVPDPIPYQIVQQHPDNFQLASPRNIGNPQAQDLEARRQIEAMKQAVAELEAQVLLA